MKESINIGILGLGIVGSGTVALLNQNQHDIERKVGVPVRIRKIALRDLRKRRALNVSPSLLTTAVKTVIATLADGETR